MKTTSKSGVNIGPAVHSITLTRQREAADHHMETNGTSEKDSKDQWIVKIVAD